MKRLAIVAAFTSVLALTPSGGALGLSCAEPLGFDLAAVLESADAGAVAEITDVRGIGQESQIVTLRVTEVLKGSLDGRLTLKRPHWEPWGPFYEEGQELALLITDDEVSDGNENLCGPWYSADELRTAATELGLESSPAVEQPGRFLSWLQSVLAVIWALVG